MALPSMTGVGRLTHDPELRFAQSGTAVATVQLAFNSNRKNDRGEWEDGDTFFVRGTAFHQLAENVAESLSRGSEVVVTGRLKTDQWQDKQTGDKRSATSMLIDAIAPSIRYATATVNKPDRSADTTSAGQQGDPWGSAPPGTQTEDDPF